MPANVFIFPKAKTTFKERRIQGNDDIRKKVTTEWNVFLWTPSVTSAQIFRKKWRVFALKGDYWRKIEQFSLISCAYVLTDRVPELYFLTLYVSSSETMCCDKHCESQKCIPRSRTTSSHEFVQSTREACQLKAAIHQEEILQWGWSLESEDSNKIRFYMQACFLLEGHLKFIDMFHLCKYDTCFILYITWKDFGAEEV